MAADTRIRTVVTGLGWMGGGVGSIDTAVEQLISSASVQLIIVAYAISDGASPLFDLVRKKLAAGVHVRIIVNRVAEQHGQIPQILSELLHDYGNQFSVFDFAAEPHAHLHAKVIVADQRRAIVGSANLSWHGLVGFHELGVCIEGVEVVEIARATERLLRHKFIRRIGVGDLRF